MDRYLRQRFLEDGFQERLAKARILVVGAGGTGSLVIEYLARMGIGYLRVLEKDLVSISNLHRQVLYTENDVGKSKLLALDSRLSSINKDLDYDLVEEFVDRNNYAKYVKDIELVIDAVDQMDTKFLINELSVREKKDLIFTSASGYMGQVLFISKDFGPCLECIIPRVKLIRREMQVFPPLVGLVASLVSSLAVEFFNSSIDKNFYLIDAKKNEIKSRVVYPNSACFCARLR